jgi:hypothetical protein
MVNISRDMYFRLMPTPSAVAQKAARSMIFSGDATFTDEPGFRH